MSDIDELVDAQGSSDVERCRQTDRLTHVICDCAPLIQEIDHVLPIIRVDPAWIVILLLRRNPCLVIRRPGIDSMRGQRDRLRLAIIHTLCILIGARLV